MRGLCTAKSAGLLRLAADAGLRHSARHGALRWDQFGQEVLRHDPPIQNTRRVKSADTLFEDRPVRVADTVLLVLASVARDATWRASVNARIPTFA